MKDSKLRTFEVAEIILDKASEMVKNGEIDELAAVATELATLILYGVSRLEETK